MSGDFQNPRESIPVNFEVIRLNEELFAKQLGTIVKTAGRQGDEYLVPCTINTTTGEVTQLSHSQKPQGCTLGFLKVKKQSTPGLPPYLFNKYHLNTPLNFAAERDLRMSMAKFSSQPSQRRQRDYTPKQFNIVNEGFTLLQAEIPKLAGRETERGSGINLTLVVETNTGKPVQVAKKDHKFEKREDTTYIRLVVQAPTGEEALERAKKGQGPFVIRAASPDTELSWEALGNLNIITGLFNTYDNPKLKAEHAASQQKVVRPAARAERPAKQERERGEGPVLSFGAESLSSEDHPERNEDTPYANIHAKVFAVFDGVGGGDSGQLSSTLAAEKLAERSGNSKTEMSIEEAQQGIADSLQAAHFEIHNLGRTLQQAKPELRGRWPGCGSTAVIGKFHKHDRKTYLTYGHVGDSRVYLFRNNTLHCLTVDDNTKFIYEKTKEVALQKQRAISNSYDKEQLAGNNIITSMLGMPDSRDNSNPKTIQFKINTIEVKKGDRIALVSDGITDNLTDNPVHQNKQHGNTSMEEVLRNYRDPNIAAQVAASTAQKFSRLYRENELDRPKPDDMSIIVIDVEEIS